MKVVQEGRAGMYLAKVVKSNIDVKNRDEHVPNYVGSEDAVYLAQG